MPRVPNEDEPTVDFRPETDATGARPAYQDSYGPGTLIAGRYRLLRRLGSGGSAHVWAAHDETLGRDVAVKMLHSAAAQGAERARLRREARVLARIDHPRITGVLDLVEIADDNGSCTPMLVTELLVGEDLGVRLGRGALGLGESLSLCAELADALDAAHRAGVVHRDVKPANVMLTSTGARLFDFGIARMDANSDLTGATAIGTPACMSPEQWLGKRVGPATDVYALGCLLYWCLTGHAPFADRLLPALAMAHLELDPPDLPRGRTRSAEIDALYRSCLAKDPAGRPTAGRVATVLARAAAPASAPKLMPMPGSDGRVLHRWQQTPKRARAAALVTTGVLVVAGAITIPLTASSADPSAAGSAARSVPVTTTVKAIETTSAAARPKKPTTSAAPAVPAAAKPTPAAPGHTVAAAPHTHPAAHPKPKLPLQPTGRDKLLPVFPRETAPGHGSGGPGDYGPGNFWFEGFR